MKISELIRELSMIQSFHGNLDVNVEDGTSGGGRKLFDVCKVGVINVADDCPDKVMTSEVAIRPRRNIRTVVAILS